jgi:rod shape-determining protein MreD
MSSNFASPKQELQHRAGNGFIALSILAAVLLNSLPWAGVWLMLRPDFVALVLLYWCMHRPFRVGIGMAWVVGIIADVADASLFGQHALAYTLLVFGGMMMHRRMQMFDVRQQTSQVFWVFVVTYAVYALVHWYFNGQMVWWYFLGCITSTFMWVPLDLLFRALLRMSMGRER